MRTKVKLGKKIYEIETQSVGKYIRIKIDGEEFLFKKTIQKEVSELEKELESEEVLDFSRKEREIKSPIAGTISEIFVRVGDKVKKGDKVITLLSMKMENEIVSEIAGVVKEIRVKKNQSVNAGEALIVL